MRSNELTFEGPKKHPLRQVRLRWHGDGRVEVVFVSGRGKLEIDPTGSQQSARPRLTVRRLEGGSAMRARRISEGERTQSGVDLMGLAVKETREGLKVPLGQEGTITNDEPLAKRFCKRCEAGATGQVAVLKGKEGEVYGFTAEQSVIVAPTGTAHLVAGEGLTVCGLETGDW